MDCEKFESAMIDELYDELDELTSAAAKRHAAGCARCASMLNGLRATRRVLSSAGGVPIVDPPAHLEERILAATREAQKVVPFRRRIANAISAAGSWAMRPQTAMAAVFLLMIGSSVVFLRGGRKMSPSSASMTVSEQGAPAEAPAAAQSAALAENEGLDVPAESARAEGKASEPAATATAMAGPAKDSNGFMDGLTNGQGRADKGGALGALAAGDQDEKNVDEGRGARARRASNAPPKSADWGMAPSDPGGAVGGAAGYGSGGGGAGIAQKPTYAQAPAPMAARPASKSAAADDVSPTPGSPPPPGPAAAPTAAGDLWNQDPTTTSPFDAAKQQYAQKNYAEATRQFDQLAASGDPNAPIWAARSTRDGSGCAAAVSRYDSVAGRQAGASAGNDALLEGGQCYRTMGQFEAARARLVRLLTVPSHAARAQRELDAMGPKATKKPAPRTAPEPTGSPSPSP